MASAIMVRKTLEELCRDRGAKGSVRLLGNDAAHIKHQEFGQIGQEELDVAIEFTKDVLKAIFQYAELLGRLRSLGKQP
jgi:hypothetical protein